MPTRPSLGSIQKLVPQTPAHMASPLDQGARATVPAHCPGSLRSRVSKSLPVPPRPYIQFRGHACRQLARTPGRRSRPCGRIRYLPAGRFHLRGSVSCRPCRPSLGLVDGSSPQSRSITRCGSASGSTEPAPRIWRWLLVLTRAIPLSRRTVELRFHRR